MNGRIGSFKVFCYLSDKNEGQGPQSLEIGERKKTFSLLEAQLIYNQGMSVTHRLITQNIFETHKRNGQIVLLVE